VISGFSLVHWLSGFSSRPGCSPNWASPPEHQDKSAGRQTRKNIRRKEQGTESEIKPGIPPLWTFAMRAFSQAIYGSRNDFYTAMQLNYPGMTLLHYKLEKRGRYDQEYGNH
jgi:hypothetical protein